MSLAAVYHAPASAARLWWLVDVRGQRVGRAATEIARLLLVRITLAARRAPAPLTAQGKHKPLYTPHVDVGDHVVVVNARHVELTGKKWQQKYYRHHTGFPGGLVERKAKNYHAEHPTRILRTPRARPHSPALTCSPHRARCAGHARPQHAHAQAPH